MQSTLSSSSEQQAVMSSHFVTSSKNCKKDIVNGLRGWQVCKEKVPQASVNILACKITRK
jgi:hypothetical protein